MEKSTRSLKFKILCILGAVVVVLGISAGVLFGINRFEFAVEPQGDSDITLNYSEEYTERGASAVLRGSLFFKDGITLGTEVMSSGNVDTSRVGTYTVEYSAGFLWWESSAERKIHIVDVKPPKITLKHIPDHYTVYGCAYVEEGFSAFDEYDGYIDNAVESEEKDGKVIYTVSDSSGNTATVEREINYIYPDPPVITLEGGNEVRIEIGTEYKESGFTAIDYFGVDLTDNVTVSGEVDSKKLGTYVVKYTVTDSLDITSTVERTVVVEPLPPTITLSGGANTVIYIGTQYKEPGFTAADYFGADLTDKVEVSGKVDPKKLGSYVLEYTVTDSLGKTAVVERTVNVEPTPAPPTITLYGESNMKIYVGKNFNDPGYYATAYNGTNVTKNVKVSGRIDINTVGTYTLTYSFTDSLGQSASVKRKVSVVARPQNNTSTPSGKVIYLTFDDGPSSYTVQLLDILDKYKVKATFFVVDTGAYDTMREIVKRGHSIGIHSISHKYSEIYKSTKAFFDDLYGMQNIIKEQTGVLTTLMRFPGGSSNTVSNFNPGIMTTLTVAVEEAGFQYFDWNVSSEDAGGAYTSSQVYNNVINGIKGKKTAIVLQHDIYKFSINAVEDIILWGLDNGYTFLPLDPTSPTSHHGVNN